MEWYKWYPAIYEADTEHLTAEQDGIYRRLIDRYMRTRQPLPDNDNALARISGVSVDSWCHASAIVKAFFRHADGKLYHAFCDLNLSEQDEKSKTKSEIGRIGAAKRWGKTQQNQSSNGSSHAFAIAQPMQEERRGDREESIKSPLPPRGRSGYPPDFETFWQTYPNRTGKAAAHKAYQSALKQHGVTHAILIDRAGQFAAAHSRAATPGQYIPHPATWLNQGRWEDDLSRITARQGAAPPAANARGSQFNALMSAASKLMQEDGRDVHAEQRPALPEREVRSPFDIQFTREPGPASLPKSADRDDPAGGQTIDHDDGNPSHG